MNALSWFIVIYSTPFLLYYLWYMALPRPNNWNWPFVWAWIGVKTVLLLALAIGVLGLVFPFIFGVIWAAFS